MSMTVSEARGLLYRRVGEYSALADLDDAMARSLRLRGIRTASRSRATDDELARMVDDDVDPFLDVAELRAWESILGNATDTGLRDVALDESPATVRDAAREKIKSLSGYVKDVYGVGLATISVGTIGLDFAAGADSGLSEGDF